MFLAEDHVRVSAHHIIRMHAVMEVAGSPVMGAGPVLFLLLCMKLGKLGCKILPLAPGDAVISTGLQKGASRPTLLQLPAKIELSASEC